MVGVNTHCVVRHRDVHVWFVIREGDQLQLLCVLGRRDMSKCSVVKSEDRGTHGRGDIVGVNVEFSLEGHGTRRRCGQ